MRTLFMLMMTVVVLLAGCSAAPGLRPVGAVKVAMAHPEVAAWYKEHSLPRIIGSPGGTDERRWRYYRPAVSVDRVTEGLVVKLHARLGPNPRDLEITLDESGHILGIIQVGREQSTR